MITISTLSQASTRPVRQSDGKQNGSCREDGIITQLPPDDTTLPDDKVPLLFQRLQAACPTPEGELNHVNSYTLLVAVVLSAQATDIGVNKATEKLFSIADTPEKILEMGEEKLREHIKTIGLYRNKAKNIIALSRILLEKYDGQIPNDREALEDLPGVGRKTANVVLNIAFGEPTIAVDTHVFRVANRTGMAPGKDVLSVEKSLERRVPDIFKPYAHHWLILHGRYICKARNPLCNQCILADLCLQYKSMRLLHTDA